MSEEFVMTEEEKKEYIQEVNEEFLKKTPMTPQERRAVRKWMSEGHCILEPWESPNLPGPMYPPYNFLDSYRLDREIDRETAGMNEKEKIRYLKNYWGCEDDEKEPDKPTETLEEAQARNRKLNRILTHLWIYLMQEGLWDEAEAYIKEHKDDWLPFGDDLDDWSDL